MDPKSNQIFFSPVINKRSLETSKKRDIFNDLYNKHKQLKFRQEENRKKTVEEYYSANCKKLISEQSEKITEEIEINMIKRIFECLDSDGDKYISEEDIKKNCHLDELKVLNPILDNIKGDTKLDINQFKKEIKEKTKNRNKIPLTLKGLSGAFLVLGIGYALAIAVLIFEVAHHNLKKRKGILNMTAQKKMQWKLEFRVIDLTFAIFSRFNETIKTDVK